MKNLCNLKCSVATLIIGAILVVGVFVIAFVVVPLVIESIIIGEVALINDTIQMERFETVPFPMAFSVTVLEITNPEQVLQGEVPEVTEVGPYVYKLYQTRDITSVEDDLIRYLRTEHFEFDTEASYPHTEDDLVTIVNVPYHAIIQIAEMSFPQLVSVLNLAISSVFGVNNSPIMTVRVRDLLFDGVRLCENPGLVGGIACGIIRDIGASAQNLAEQDDGSLLFSLLAYKQGIPSPEYEVYRGVDDVSRLGDIISLGGYENFLYWVDENISTSSICNAINGTDSGIYAPFVDREKSLYAINTDICRSVELRYQNDLEIDGIPAVRFSANEWFLANDEGCFCLNVTTGITRDDGCLLEGAMELYTCVGAMLVLTYPHFLYADMRYRNGLVGMTPDENKHKIFVDLEPNTGTPIAGAKRAQFNIFMRPVSGITATQTLRSTLTPIFWIEEGFTLPDEFRGELRDRLLRPLNILDIVMPIAIALCCLVLLLGIIFTVKAKLAKPPPSTAVVDDTEHKN